MALAKTPLLIYHMWRKWASQLLGPSLVRTLQINTLNFTWILNRKIVKPRCNISQQVTLLSKKATAFFTGCSSSKLSLYIAPCRAHCIDPVGRCKKGLDHFREVHILKMTSRSSGQTQMRKAVLGTAATWSFRSNGGSIRPTHCGFPHLGAGITTAISSACSPHVTNIIPALHGLNLSQLGLIQVLASVKQWVSCTAAGAESHQMEDKEWQHVLHMYWRHCSPCSLINPNEII